MPCAARVGVPNGSAGGKSAAIRRSVLPPSRGARDRSLVGSGGGLLDAARPECAALAGMFLVLAALVWLRREAESGRLTARVRRAVRH